MKTLVRTIALIAVISLSCVCFSKESEEKVEKARVELEEAQKLLQKKQEDEQSKLEEVLRGLTRQREELERSQEQLQRRLTELDRQVEAVIPTPGTQPAPATEKMSGIVLSSGRAGDIADISVVITSKDSWLERISQATEDMGIMARILDKQVLEIPAPKTKQMTFGDRSFYYLRSEAPGEGTTRGIYISGYGALFLMDVDFPLLPEPKFEEKEEKKADVGDIWEQTKDELTGRYRGFGPDEREIKIDKQKVAFDEDKVKELKEKITKALKYASNIRSLEPDEKIIVSVKSVIHQGSETIREIKILGRQFGMQTGRGGGFGGGGYGGALGGGFDEEKVPKPITGITIMVDKGAADSFAKGELDYDEFLENVKIIEY